MEFDFAKSMKETDDVGLIKIVTVDRDHYQETALRAAEVELELRQVSLQLFEMAKTHLEKGLEVQNYKAAIPLENYWQFAAFIFPVLLQLILSGIFKSDGHNRKADELAKWTFLGFGFYIVVMIFFSL